MANVRDFQVVGNSPTALFTLKLHRGEGMTLIAMDWKNGNPPNNFVGFSIEFKEPDRDVFFVIENRITFEGNETSPNRFSSLQSPIQKFRWVHFPRNAEKPGEFTYRVKPVFMNIDEKLSYGEAQEAHIELKRETYPDLLNVTFTRGFISSQAFVNKYGAESIPKLLPAESKDGPNFTPTHQKSKEALAWMGFEACSAIMELLDDAIAEEDSKVYVVAFDLSQADIIRKFEALGNRLEIIIDDSSEHKKNGSGENQAEVLLKASAGNQNVKRQKMGGLQHNKMIIIESAKLNAVVFGSTNFTWRGLYVQANNAVIVKGKLVVNIGKQAFEDYWNNAKVATFSETTSAVWKDLQLNGIDAKVVFSPHNSQNSVIDEIANDIENNVESSLFYSLAFLHQTPGVIRNAINNVTNKEDIFVYGMADNEIKNGIVIQKPDGNLVPVFAKNLTEKSLPQPFKPEPAGGRGTQLHHKFLVLDFDKSSARVYLGSYNFSIAADVKNGENLVLIKDRRIATSYMIEAVRLFDHYHFRVNQMALNSDGVKKKIFLRKPPKQTEKTWWQDDFTNGTIKFRDRKLFA